MTSDRRFDQDLPDLLAQVAQGPAPDYRDSIVQRTARVRQRPAWTFPERWLPMSVVTSRAAPAQRIPFRIVGVVALLLIVLIVGAALISGSQRHLPAPFGPAADGRVAFAKGGDIYTADPVSGVSAAVVTGAEDKLEPVWSPDGTRFVFKRQVTSPAGDAQLFVARADGSGVVAITTAPQSQLASYTFSPDGNEVAFTAVADGSSQLWIAKSDGSGARRLDVGMSVIVPSFRPPDGGEIVFASDPGDIGGNGIYAVAVATGAVRTIVQPSGQVGLDRVMMAPDGSRVAYPAWTPGSTVNTYRVQVSRLDDSKTLTLPMPQGATFQDAPAWSNDGTRIAVTRGYAAHNEAMTLAVLPADGTSVGTETARGLTGCCDTVIDWAPDDKSILVSPEDLYGNFLPQLLLGPATGATHPAPWAAIADPAWQRIAP